MVDEGVSVSVGNVYRWDFDGMVSIALRVPRSRLFVVLPGLALAACVALPATLLGQLIPVIGGPVFGIVFGLGVSVLVRPGVRLRPGLGVAGRQVLQAAVVVFGAGLSLGQVVHVGAASLPVMLGTLAVALCGARLFGRLLGVSGDASTLVGAGTGICGASAVAAVAATIGAAEIDVAYAIGTIFTFNVAAVLLFPALGHLLGLSQQAFGLWAGTAINDTSSVVAAAYSYGGEAGAHAVVVKLTRSLMIIPLCIGLAAARAGRTSGSSDGAARTPWRRMVPAFLVGFVGASALNTVGAVPVGWHPAIASIGLFLVTVALAGIGLSIEPATLFRAGPRPLLLGAILWLSVAITSLAMQALSGAL